MDVSGYLPRHVGQAMDALGDRVGRYMFISSHAVYRRDVGPGATEDAPRRPPVRNVRHTEDLDARVAGTRVEIVPVPPEPGTLLFPLIRPS